MLYSLSFFIIMDFVSFWAFYLLISAAINGCTPSNIISLGSRLLASENEAWVSENGTFAFGFTPATNFADRFLLAIWFAKLPGDRVIVWSPYLNSPVTKDAILELDASGNLNLIDKNSYVWTTNTSTSLVEGAFLLDNGNFILYTANQSIVWQSFSHPSDTLLPGQPLLASLELKSTVSPSHGGYYTLKMLQKPTSLSLGLTYNLPEDFGLYSNYSYWSGPEISNVTGQVVALLDEAGSFGIVYGSSSDGAVYVHKSDEDDGDLSSATNETISLSVIRRLTLEKNGNLRLYRWDNDLKGSHQWVSEWAAVSNPCDIAGICGNGICKLDKSKTNATCCLPGSELGNDGLCWGNSSLTGKCDSHHENLTSELKTSVVQQTNYYFSDLSVIANYSDMESVSKCGDACLSDCDCVASVYGLNEEKPYCWILKSLGFGGFLDPASTLFVKVESNGSSLMTSGARSKDSSTLLSRKKVLVIPIVLSMIVLIMLLCSLLYMMVHKKRSLKRALENSFIASGAPINFSYRALQNSTNNFSHLLGTGGFGGVYKGSLGDGTMIGVKKLERVLPHGEKEFITEVNTISSMHHMNLVRLWGYCSQGPQRLLVYGFMKNGSLDKWIFPSNNKQDRFLDWSTRFQVAIGTAQGIAYFHEQCRDRIIHCDIKPENILLDDNFCPKVSDFGLAKLMGREHSHVVTMVRGTRGYLAPEWISNRPITVKADVYSYGMLLLEIIGGRRNLDMTLDADSFYFPCWAFKELEKGTATKVADPRLGGAMEEEEFIRAVKTAFWCIQDEVFMRPSMGEVVKMLEGSTFDIKMPPMPQAVLEMLEEGLDHVCKAMKKDFCHFSSTTIITQPSSRATCSYSTMSPR